MSNESSPRFILYEMGKQVDPSNESWVPQWLPHAFYIEPHFSLIKLAGIIYLRMYRYHTDMLH